MGSSFISTAEEVQQLESYAQDLTRATTRASGGFLLYGPVETHHQRVGRNRSCREIFALQREPLHLLRTDGVENLFGASAGSSWLTISLTLDRFNRLLKAWRGNAKQGRWKIGVLQCNSQ